MKNNNACKLYKGFADFESLENWLAESTDRRFAALDEYNIYYTYIDDDKKYRYVGIEYNHKPTKKVVDNDVKKALAEMIKILNQKGGANNGQ